ncbi:hypothetical protein FRC01_006988, partial [Tulasnella sp. 417]
NTVKSVEITVKPDPYDIPGAKPIQNGDFEIGDDIDFMPAITSAFDTNFWDSLVHVNLGDNKLRVAKIYSSTKNSTERFKQDMQFFADNMGPRIARLYGYNAESRHPYIIFSLDSVKPLRRYLTQLSQDDYSRFLIQGWRLLQDMYETPLKKAGDYLCKHSKNVWYDWRAVAASMQNAAVGSNGQLVIAPSSNGFFPERPNPEDYSRSAIMITWSDLLVDVVQEQHYRALRPFTLALRESAREFLEYDTHKLTTPSQVASVIQTLWSALEDRPYRTMRQCFDPGVIPGDVGFFEVGGDYLFGIRFRHLTNIAGAFGGIRFHHPANSTNTPNVYRDTVYSKIDEPYRLRPIPSMTWQYRISKADVPPAKLAREFTIIGERYGVRPSSLAMVRVVNHCLSSKSGRKMESAVQTGRPVHCYATFGPDNRFQSARWSFHDNPPTEEEAAAEASEIEALHCPTVWSEIWSGIPYCQLEDEDIEFHLKNPGKEEEPARIELVEESSGSTSADT